jgi:hypothetical protein
MNDLVVVITAILFALGVGLAGVAWWLAGKEKKWINRSQVVGGLSTGILTGAVVAVGVLLLQLRAQTVSNEAAWRQSVEMAKDIPGFDPAGHSLAGLNLSGHKLRYALLRRANLTGAHLIATDLKLADLRGADLRDAVMVSANLSEAGLSGADLSGAQLEGAHFEFADVEHAKFAERMDGRLVRAVADAATCWPRGFLELPVARQIKPAPFELSGASRGREYPHCLRMP